MPATDIRVDSADTIPVRQPVDTAPAVEANSAPAKSDPLPTQVIPAQEISAEAASRKDHTLDILSDLNQQLDEAIETLNAAVKESPTALSFSRDDSSNRFVVQVTDTETGEVIRNLPGEAVLRVARQLESLKGVLFDELF